jgi:maleylpyruvate isomerase
VPLLPSDPGDRAYVRQVAMHIACDVHPLNNLRVLKFLSGPLKLSEDQRQAWIKHWIELGLEGLEADISKSGKAGRFCFGDAPTMADCCLVPQLASAQRFDVNIARYPMLKDIHDACEQLAAFRHAHPSKQPDAE